jgi:hypothetical protein
MKLPTYEERLQYLMLNGRVGEDTFGSRRYLNQVFYRSYEWQKFRKEIILRDKGCDLGLEGYEILGKIYIHHINPIYIKDIEEKDLDILLNPENAISVSFDTHQRIHYENMSVVNNLPIERSPNDTCPWK